MALFIVVGCSRTDTKSMEVFLNRISHGPENELGELIYGYTKATPSGKMILLGLTKGLRAPSADQHMTIEALRDAGRFTMLAVHVPWPAPTIGARVQPILICHEDGRDRLVGYVLPFDDIFRYFQGADTENILELSQWWVESYGTPH